MRDDFVIGILLGALIHYLRKVTVLAYRCPVASMLFVKKAISQTVKNLPSMQETRVQSLDWEHPLEKGMVTHSSILAWKISWTEETGGLQSMGS